ncbi:thiamine phosphate synthase [Geomesophilobacter sediminis]|uniref:Thiamine-phosphate synthase n=1 Tax=Geomesophilobacter sediminis TaxID=2798584 RepID=A0A8J7M0V8_9BACT|nr:thiamine phosphate synthase [Geomesophilobacter sediminis]MBJ6726570.1 thiamine phosphate synthase [Geomesophilobacter sediminis]
MTAERSPRVDFNLYLITDRTQTRDRNLEFVLEEALHGGVRAVQLREKDLSSKALYELAYDLRRLTSRYNARLIINDRTDVAQAVDADGVHIGVNSLPLYKVRRLIGDKKLIGVSCHNQVQAITAQEMGADFITFGPVYYTPSKAAYGEPVGVERLAEVAELLEIPVFALGGVKRKHCGELLAAGAHGVGVISAILSAPDPRRAARELRGFLPASEPRN